MTKKNARTAPLPKVILEGKNIPTLDIFYSLIATKLRFPEFFGRDFDALVECLGDIGKSYITIYHRDAFLSKEPQEKKDMLEKIFDSVEGVQWKKK